MSTNTHTIHIISMNTPLTIQSENRTHILTGMTRFNILTRTIPTFIIGIPTDVRTATSRAQGVPNSEWRVASIVIARTPSVPFTSVESNEAHHPSPSPELHSGRIAF